MRKLLGLLFLILTSLPAAAANICGSGILCTNTTTLINNVNSPTPTPITIFTAPATGNTIILAINLYNPNSSLGGQTFTYSMIHGATTYEMWTSPTPQAAPYNMLVFSPFSPAPQPNAPVTSDGNPFLIIAPGDSITVISNNNIPSGGSGAGPYNFNVQAQTFTN